MLLCANVDPEMGLKTIPSITGDGLRDRSNSLRDPFLASYREGAGIPVEPMTAPEWKEIERRQRTHEG
jgi:hypothetical protein